VPHARAPPPLPGVASQASGRGWVLPLNPHNYGSFSLLRWRRLDCESFASYRLFASRLLGSSAAPLLPCRGHIFRCPPSVLGSLRFRETPHLPLLTGLPVLVPARTGDWESRPPECLSSSSSPARVKGDNHVFGECRCDTTTRLVLFVPA
jgi:hypothetical protein